MAKRRLRLHPDLHAQDVPRAPRRVPASEVVREHLFPFATGASWMLVGAVALLVARFEGLPPPEKSNLGSGVAWLIGVGLVAAGAAVFSWALVRGTWWSRLQRHGRAVDATVTGVRQVSWVVIGGRAPLDLELSFEDGGGRACGCRVRTRPSWREADVEVGESVVVVHAPDRPEEAALYWKR